VSEIPASSERLNRGRSALLVVDMQGRILAAIENRARPTWNIRRLIDGAGLFDVPVSVTEQYPERLGGTTEELTDNVSPALPPALPKRRFSCLECGELVDEWREAGRFQIVVCGIETHVCVQQTVLDLLSESFQVQVVADAVTARGQMDHDISLRRMESAGATLTTTEAALFEWCGDSRDPQFKKLSALIQEPPPE